MAGGLRIKRYAISSSLESIFRVKKLYRQSEQSSFFKARNFLEVLVGTPDGKIPLGSPRCRRKEIIRSSSGKNYFSGEGRKREMGK
jgi:hypothetical protein